MRYSTVNPDGVQLYVQLYSMFTFGMVNVTYTVTTIWCTIITRWLYVTSGVSGGGGGVGDDPAQGRLMSLTYKGHIVPYNLKNSNFDVTCSSVSM